MGDVISCSQFVELAVSLFGRLPIQSDTEPAPLAASALEVGTVLSERKEYSGSRAVPNGFGHRGESQMHPRFEEFVAALRDPALRAPIGLSIGDADAAALLTRYDWATDYYDRWLAMFPVATAASAESPRVPEPVSVSAFAVASADPFGPPPVLNAPVATPEWEVAPAASRIPTSARSLIIVAGSLLVAVVLVVTALNVWSSVFRSAVASRPAAVRSSTTATTVADDVPADTHGLTDREYRLMEVIFESEKHTIPAATAAGMSDSRLRSLTDTVNAEAGKTCASTASISDGFDNPVYRASFIAGYTVSAKVGPDVAATVYQAISHYCASS